MTTNPKPSASQLNIKRGSAMHLILTVLANERDLSTKQIKTRIGNTRAEGVFRTMLLSPMAICGLIAQRNSSSDLWHITNEGIEQRLMLGDLPGYAPAPRRDYHSVIENIRARGDYIPLELTSRVMRDGAYDAFKLPSVSGNSARWRDERGMWHDTPHAAGIKA